MMSMEERFFRLLRMAIGQEKAVLGEQWSEEVWQQLYAMAKEQTVAGVLFEAVKCLPKEEQPGKVLLCQWYMLAQQIASHNEEQNRLAVFASRTFAKEGFATCVLKGQGNARLYPNPLSRTSGDLDIWCLKADELGQVRQKGLGIDQSRPLIEYVRRLVPKATLTNIHIDFPVIRGKEIEVHFSPSYLSSPLYNKRLQAWFAEHAEEQFGHRVLLPNHEEPVVVPKPEFNVVFQLSHLFRHHINGGVGLRQVMDFYYLLTDFAQQDGAPEKMKELKETLRYVGLLTFARAVNEVLQCLMAMPAEYFAIGRDEKRGRFLLNEVLQAGNFGKYDRRVNQQSMHSRLYRYVVKFKASFRFLCYYPKETCWFPLFQLALFFKIKWKNVQLKNLADSHGAG